MLEPALQAAIESVPAGRWAVGVSGGADSVALLSLLRARPDLRLTVVHLDHETRAGASAADAAFVRELADGWRIPCVVDRLSAIQPMLPRVTTNVSARWRQARLTLYRRTVEERGLRGVILAHHADDQAETIFHRLLRSSRPAGVTAMVVSTTLSGITVLRPLLSVRREALRDYLRRAAQPWREDESNASPRYARNRIRRLLAARPQLVDPLLELGERCRDGNRWVRETAPSLAERFHVDEVRRLPLPAARLALLLWLRRRGSLGADYSTAERLLAMTLDAASPPRQHFPGRVLVCRRRGEIFAA